MAQRFRKRKLGPGFSNEVIKVTSKTGLFKVRENDDWKDTLIPNFDDNLPQRFEKNSKVVVIFACICLVLFFIIFLRLFHLQIVKGGENRELADGNRIQITTIHASRGVIFDRNGKILAANSPAFRLFEKQDGGGKKVRLISRDEALALEVKNDPKSANLEVDNVRTYPEGEKLAHVVGYVGEISQDQLKTSEYKTYHLGDRIGQVGIEAQYEKLLRGTDGGEIIEVDSTGKKLRTLRTNPPIPGQNINLTIDSSLQNIVYQNLKQALLKGNSCCGVAVVMDPNNGQILSLVSLPAYDPNIFTSAIDDNAISQVFSQKEAPALNRVISGTYPPGSTFKIVSALAALNSGISPDKTIQDNGVIYLGATQFTNWYFTEYGRTEGPVNLVKALQRSNDTYFYEIGRTIGQDKLTEWAKKLKLGSKLGIDLPGESAGLIPDDGWKRKIFGVGWYPGDTLHMSIGQGFVSTTPLQVLGITSFIAADGVMYQPQMVLTNFKPKVLVSKLATADKIGIIQDGLKLVPKDGGTAWPFFPFSIETAGKTGTAEFGDPKNKTHAWYTSYAPANDPKIAMTVLVEAGGEGSTIAAPVTKEVYRWYFSEDKNKLIKDINSQATDSGKILGE